MLRLFRRFWTKYWLCTCWDYRWGAGDGGNYRTAKTASFDKGVLPICFVFSLSPCWRRKLKKNLFYTTFYTVSSLTLTVRRDVSQSINQRLCSPSICSLALFLLPPSSWPLIKAKLWLPRATANYTITHTDTAAGIWWDLKSQCPLPNPRVTHRIFHVCLHLGMKLQRHWWVGVWFNLKHSSLGH